MLYTCAGNMQNAFARKFRGIFVVEPLDHIHQDTKSAGLIAVCKRSLYFAFRLSPVHQYFIFRFLTLHCLRSTLRLFDWEIVWRTELSGFALQHDQETERSIYFHLKHASRTTRSPQIPNKI